MTPCRCLKYGMLPAKEQACSLLHLCFLEQVEGNRVPKASAAETNSAVLQELCPRAPGFTLPWHLGNVKITGI